MMLYKATRRIFEAGKHYETGDPIELSEQRAKALRGMVEPLTREMPSAPVDREIKRRRKK